MVPWLFSKTDKRAPPPPPAPAPVSLSTQIRQNKRVIDRVCRDIERERLRMEQQEKQAKAQISKLAKEGLRDSARVIAKVLVRTRHHISRTYQMKTQLESVGMQLATMRTNKAMASAMGNVVTIMAKMNHTMNIPALQQVLMQFEREHGKMEMTQEMMDDAMGDVLSADDEENRTDEIISQVMDELGLENRTAMNTADAPAQEMGATDSNALQARLDALQK